MGRRVARIAAPGAVVAGLVASGLALATLPSPTSATSASLAIATRAPDSPVPAPGLAGATRLDTTRLDAYDLTAAKREDRANRGTSRPSIAEQSGAEKPDLDVAGTRYATVALNVRSKPDEDARLVKVLASGARVKITDTTKGQWRLIVRDGKGQWVKKRYLSTKRPDPSSATFSNAPCKGGSAMESGLTPDAIKVHRALCARYPQITSYGGVRQGDGGEHGSGHAVDAMISNSTVGWQAARWLRANAKQLGISQVIYSQRIWTVQRGSEGWRSMSDRGSTTANHYDHVHITVYGNAAR